MTKAYSYIRFSTTIQQLGHSPLRQKELVDNYLKDHTELTLDTTIQDSGVSAWKGINRIKGALGAFLKLVEQGKIEKGSVLLVEHLDRLSRQDVDEAYDQFRSILKAGIKIVTLQDGMEYTKGGNIIQLLTSIILMSQANQESEKKSIRLLSKWEDKRHRTVKGEIKLTGRVPFWIEYKDGKFEPKKEAVKAITLIFQKKLDGKGEKKITHELNIAPSDVVWKPLPRKFKIDPTRGTRGGWEQTTITKLLRNRQLLGEFEPCKMVDGKRKGLEIIIPNYFPKVIDEKLFNRVQHLLDERSKVEGYTGGKTGKAYNVFAHIVKCGFCGNPMHYVDKGRSSSKDSQTLHCSESRDKKKECSAKPVHYNEFFDLFFGNFEELDMSQLMPEEKETKLQIQLLSKEIDANKGEISKKLKQVKNLTDLTESKDIKTSKDTINTFTVRINERNAEIRILEIKNKELTEELKKLENQKTSIEKDFEGLKEIHQLLNQANDEEEKINIRLKLRSVLISMIDWIKIYPLQSEPQRLENLIAKRDELKKSNQPISLNTKMRISALNDTINLIEEGKDDDQEPEPGISLRFDSKTIDKVRIKLNGGNIRSIYLKRYVEKAKIS